MSSKELNKIEDLLKGIDKLYVRLGKSNPFDGKPIKEIIKELGGVKNATFSLRTNLKGLNAELIDASSGLKDIAGDITFLLQNIGVKGPTAIQSYTKSFRSLKSIASQLLEIQDDLGETSEKEIIGLKKRNELENIRAERSLNNIFEEGKAAINNESDRIKFDEAREKYADLLIEKKKATNAVLTKEAQIEESKIKRQNLLAEGKEKEAKEQLKIHNELGKELKTLRNAESIADERYKTNTNILQSTGKIADKELEALAQAKERENTQTRLNKALDENLRRVKNINKAQGITGDLVKGLGSSLEKLGFGNLGLGDVQSQMKELSKDLTNNGDKAAGFGIQFRVMSKGLLELGKNLASSLSDPLIVIGLVVKGFKELVDLGSKVAKESATLGQQFMGLGAEASGINQSFKEMADGEPFFNVQEARDAFVGLNTEFGTAVEFSKEESKIFKKMSHDLALGAENTAKLYRVAQLSGTGFGEITEEIRGTVQNLNDANGTAINLTDVIKDVANVSSTVRANLSNNPKALAGAVYQARRLMMTVDEISSAASTTLDFESSIEKQFKAQMLLGKSLNLVNLRRAALSGDAETQGKEINRLIAENADKLKGNVLAQKAFAEMLGITQDRLMAGLESQEMQEALAKKGLANREGAEKTILRYMKEQNLTREQALEKITSAEDLDRIEASQKASETLSRAFQSIKESFTVSLAPVAEKLAGKLKELLDGDGFQRIQKVAESIGKVLASITGFAIENPLTTAVAGIGLSLGKKLMGLGKRGSSPMNPIFTSDITGGIGGKLKGLNKIFSKGGKFGKVIAGLSKQMTKVGVAFGSKKSLAKVTQATMKATGKKVYGAAAQSAVKSGAAKIAGTKATSAAAKAAAKAGGKAAAKTGGKAAAKAIGKGILKKIPVIGLLAGAAFAINRASKGDYAGAMGELASGAVSLIPGFGTAASVAIDAGLAARDVSNSMDGSRDIERSNPTVEMSDFISRPGEPIRQFRKDDIIIGGTNLDGTNNSPTPSSPNNDQVIQLLERLITTVEQGGDVYLDSSKVGTALSMASYRTQ